ncbi:MAG: hypothetical protein ACM37W_13450 [Actinomycetota bacterium]
MFNQLTATPKNDQAPVAWVQANVAVATAQILHSLCEQVNQNKRVPVGWID